MRFTTTTTSGPLPPPTPLGKGGPSPRGHNTAQQPSSMTSHSSTPSNPTTTSSPNSGRSGTTPSAGASSHQKKVGQHTPPSRADQDGRDRQEGAEEEHEHGDDVFAVEAYYPVFVSMWTRETGMCSICRNLVEGPCIICQTSAVAAQTCHMCWGVCGHAFHDHCIQRWLKSRQVCPLDNTPWENQPGWSDAHHGLQLALDEEVDEEKAMEGGQA